MFIFFNSNQVPESIKSLDISHKMVSLSTALVSVKIKYDYKSPFKNSKSSIYVLTLLTFLLYLIFPVMFFKTNIQFFHLHLNSIYGHFGQFSSKAGQIRFFQIAINH